MKKLRFEYSMELKFSSPVSSHYFALRCVPGDSLRQKVVMTECRVRPSDYASELEDGFGNLKLSGCCAAPHDFFSYCVKGMVETEGMGVWKGPLHPMYRYPSAYTRFEPEVVRFARKFLRCVGRSRRRQRWKKQSAPCTICMRTLNICRERRIYVQQQPRLCGSEKGYARIMPIS